MTGTGRREDDSLLRGRGSFTDDVHLDGMVHGVFIRSPLAHAEVQSIDASPALAAGALCVLTREDLPFRDKPWVVRHTHPGIRGGSPGYLAGDRVRYLGEPVAFVVAPDRYVAEDLAALVRVEYRPVEALADTSASLRHGAPRIHEAWDGNVAATLSHKRGDATTALDAATHRFKRSFRFRRQVPLPLETRGVVAHFDPANRTLTAWMSTQAHYNLRQNLASMLDLPEAQVRVIAGDVGGGFGSKSRPYPEEMVVSHASRVLGRPVKWIEDRFEHLQATTHSRGIETELELGCDAGGRILGLRATLTVDIGAYVFTSGIITSETASANITGAYHIPDFDISVRCVGTNCTPLATYRGAGQPEATFPMECLLDLVSREFGIPPLELRRRNLVKSDSMPYRRGTHVVGIETTFDSGDFPAMLDAMREDPGYSEPPRAAMKNERSAWGLACGIEGGGFSNFESARVRIDTAGRIWVHSGISSQGQGQRTALARVCADVLGVEMNDVTVHLGDTQLLPFGRGSFASRGALYGASAAWEAATRLREQVLDLAGRLLGCAPGSLTLAGGRITPRDGGTSGLSLADVARAVAPGGPLFEGQVALEVQHVYKADQVATYAFSVHAAKVSVDTRTGIYRVTDYVVVHDAGHAIDPVIVDGQVVGGVAEGIGGAMFSEIVYDETGQLLTGTLADYLVATAPEIPRIRLIHRHTPATTNPLGVRGIGEGGVIPAAAAIANALARAIGGGRTGHEAPLYQVPIKPESVLEALTICGHDGNLPGALHENASTSNH